MGKERLPDSGYYIEYYSTKEEENPDEFSTIHVSEDKKCKYVGWSGSKDWNTLLWSCCPTKKQIEEAKTLADGEGGMRYHFFSTFEELKNFKGVGRYPVLLVKPSPLDKNAKYQGI